MLTVEGQPWMYTVQLVRWAKLRSTSFPLLAGIHSTCLCGVYKFIVHCSQTTGHQHKRAYLWHLREGHLDLYSASLKRHTSLVELRLPCSVSSVCILRQALPLYSSISSTRLYDIVTVNVHTDTEPTQQIKLMICYVLAGQCDRWNWNTLSVPTQEARWYSTMVV